MQKKYKNILPLTILAIFALAALVYWLSYNPVRSFQTSKPGMDNRPTADAASADKVRIGEHFMRYAKDTLEEFTGTWSRFRGSDFDNIKKNTIPLIDNWGKGPKITWKKELGEGHAAPAIYKGKVYILDYDEKIKADALRCFSLETGEELWKRWYNVHVKRNHGMSRTVPAVNEKYIITIGPKCHVMCSERETGDLLWGIDLVKDYNTEIPHWYTGQCPIIDNDTAVIAPGGTALLIGIDCKTGERAWQTPNSLNWKMSHSSIMPMTFKGKKMYVYAGIGGICGISAKGEDIGKILWTTTEFAPSVVAPSPLILDNGLILMTAGYGAGGMLFKLVEKAEGFDVQVLQKYKPKDGIASEQQTPIFWQNRVFAILPKDAGGSRNQFVCSKPTDCMNILWTSGKTKRYGLGPYIIADGKFFILNDDGTLTIAKASTEKFIELDKAKIIDGQDAWGPIAIADGRLIMRDSKEMVCIDIRKK